MLQPWLRMRPSKIMGRRKTLADFVEPDENLWFHSIVLGLREVGPIDPHFGFRLIQRIEEEIETGKIKELGVGLFGRKLSATTRVRRRPFSVPRGPVNAISFGDET